MIQGRVLEAVTRVEIDGMFWGNGRSSRGYGIKERVFENSCGCEKKKPVGAPCGPLYQSIGSGVEVKRLSNQKGILGVQGNRRR